MTPEQQSPSTGRVSDELRIYLDRGELQGIDELADRLRSARAVPAPAFRSRLRAHLAGRDVGAPAEGWRPARLQRLVVAYLGSGLVLLAVAALGLAGAGPLGY